MKKLLTIAVASLAFAAMAEYSAPQIGVTTITATAKNTIIPVPFLSLSDGSSAVSAADLVKTTNLKSGTWMLAVSGNAYSAWTLTEDNGTWTPTAINSTALGITATAAASDATLIAGSAIWIVLPDAESYSTAITVYGAYSSSVTSTVDGDTAATATLIANPIQGSATFAITTAVAGDQIVVPTNSSADRYVCKLRKSTQTLVWSKDGAVAGLPTLTVGQGIWYIRAAGAADASIAWTAQ